MSEEENQKAFATVKSHQYRPESIHDETCLECGFPERFHPEANLK